MEKRTNSLDEVREKIEKHPWRVFRIGTWELGDSLALEDKTGQASALIKDFSTIDRAFLELKTKSDCVDPILECDHKQKTVVSWSMSPQSIIGSQEHKTASLKKRLIAIKKVVKAGYLVGFHFDPMILHPNWKEAYQDLVAQIAEVAPQEQTAWISFGSLRFNPEMKKKMEENFPANTITSDEMALGSDGKVRYVKPKRIEMYKAIYETIQTHFPDVLTYLCMERWDMWDKVFGYHPSSIGDLDYMFTKSLRDRYPHLIKEEPQKELYIKHQFDRV